MASAGASDDVSVPGLGSTGSGAGADVPVSLGLGSWKVEGVPPPSLALDVSPMPVALTPTITASPPSRPMATATPTRAISPVRTGRFSLSMGTFQPEGGALAIVQDG